MKNKHLSSEERDKITILQGEGLSIRKIAGILDRSPSTISREINRKEALFFRGKYIGSQTDRKVKENWKNSHKRTNVFLNNPFVFDFILKELKNNYTPEIICHELLKKFNNTVSTETLYQFIYKERNENLKQYLLRRKLGRIKRYERPKYVGTGKNIPNRIDISNRPEMANNRVQFGHFEADSVESCKRKIKGEMLPCLTVLVERKSRYTIIRKTASKTSKQTAKSILEALKPYSLNNTIKSITYDNGCEFSLHEKINNLLDCKSYFARPYCSNDKGTVENINGLIRRFFPKGTNFDNITNEEIAYVENWINNRPMKIHNYMTPRQIFQLNSVAIAS